MGGRLVRRRVEYGRKWDGLVPLLVLGLCFFLGLVFGLCFSMLRQDSGELSNYLTEYFRAVGENGSLSISIWSVIWDLVRWPLFVFLLGFTALGVVAIPALLLVRGFLLSYSVTTFVGLFGTDGLVAALAAFGITALLLIPVLFVVAFDGLRSSIARLAGGAEETAPRLLRQRLTILAPCAGIIILATALQWTAMPALLSAVCARFFAS